MESNDELYKKIVTLLKIFKNRPYHLAKYLMENNAFNKAFINKISKSNKLDEISADDEINKYLPANFNSIQHMQDFYDSLLDEIKQISTNKSKKQLEIELNEKLDDYIKSEKFEEAAKLRDYMSKNSIKRKNNNL
jgi:uncharacterized protein (DUF1330 family)